MPLGPGAVATLKGALRQALHLGHNYIGTEHILLGLVDEQDTTAATLAGLGLTRRPRAARDHGGVGGPAGQPEPGWPAQAPRTWIPGRSREKARMNGTCCWVASVT